MPVFLVTVVFIGSQFFMDTGLDFSSTIKIKSSGRDFRRNLRNYINVFSIKSTTKWNNGFKTHSNYN